MNNNATNPERIVFKNQHLFRLKDHLHDERFWWPETMLTYPMDFSMDAVTASGLALIDLASGKQIPYQLSDVRTDHAGRLLAADLHFIAGLRPGEEHRFMLTKETPERFESPVRVRQEEEGYWVENGPLAAYLPGSRTFPSAIPGPIMRLRANGRIFGASSLHPGSLRILEIVTACRSLGPVFAAFTVTYRFDGGKSYECELTFVRGMEFAAFTERMNGITEQDGAYFRFNWSGFAPTHRYAPNNPAILIGGYDTPYEELNWNRIDEEATGGYTHPVGMWSNGKNGEIPFRLSLYEPQSAIVRVNSATFWDEHSGQSVGAFILDEGRWDNGRYDLFCSWDGFAVSFFYENGLLWWKYPLSAGIRSTALAAYAHEKDIAYFERVRPAAPTDAKFLAGGTRMDMHGASYCTFLHNRYSLLSLQNVKDYVLEYPEQARRGDLRSVPCPYPDAESFESFLMNYILVSKLPAYGTRENAGFSPVPYRRMVPFAAAYSRYWTDFPPGRRKRIEAVLLLLTYLAAGEHVVPMKHMLGGPPNLQGDVRRALGYISVLFPEHPEAKRWQETFAKFVELSLRMYTRPELKGLRLEGGRWAENLGTYTWAFLVPALKTAMLLEERADLPNLFANRHAAMLGRWLVHSLTAPFEGENEASLARMGSLNHYWGSFARGQGPHRVYLPIGAHAARRTPPRSIRAFAKRLERYDPLLAENLHYIDSGLADDFESRSQEPPEPLDERTRWKRGTRPEFRTMAFTGFGVMLRSGVYTPSEVSVFVQQVDEGPNYRWGTAGMGGSGNIYYYAQGKAYSHNGKEDAGDRRLNDCEVGCTFGVWKKNKFSTIGPNVIMNAYHALGTFQYTAIEPEKDELSYSYPEYAERNVLLSGTDYLSVFDRTGTPAIRHRFTWSVSSDDRMPFIHLLSGYDYTGRLTTEGKGGSIDSVWYEGSGSGFAVVTHREDVRVEKRGYGAVVEAPEFKDTLLRSSVPLKGEFDGIAFEGTAGAVRAEPDGTVEIALLRGTSIGAQSLFLASESGKAGLSLRRSPAGDIAGFASCLQDDRIRVEDAERPHLALYIDSLLQEPDEAGWYRLPAGEHTLQLVCAASDLPVPADTRIERVIHGDGLCEVHFSAAAGADRYVIQISEDYGESWQTRLAASGTSCVLDGLANGQKYFVRVRGENEKKRGRWSHEYPAYPTDRLPPPPDGLDIIVRGDELTFSWGQVAGASEYRLYRIDAGGAVVRLYAGKETQFSCRRAAPGEISRYTVSSVNRNGEGERHRHEADDDPNSLRNFKPLIDRPFRRNSLYNHHPFELQHAHKYRDVPSVYPESFY